jgi:acyl dehydratase
MAGANGKHRWNAVVAVFSKPIDDRYLEDYISGDVHDCGSVVVDETEIIAFAKKFDPQAMHVDKDQAALGRYNGLIASGWHTASMMMRLYVENYLSAVASRASPGVDELRWHVPVRPGDRLRLRVTVLDIRPTRKPDRGLVTSRMEGLNQDDVVVCSMRGMNILERRPPKA